MEILKGQNLSESRNPESKVDRRKFLPLRAFAELRDFELQFHSLQGEHGDRRQCPELIQARGFIPLEWNWAPKAPHTQQG